MHLATFSTLCYEFLKKGYINGHMYTGYICNCIHKYVLTYTYNNTFSITMISSEWGLNVDQQLWQIADALWILDFVSILRWKGKVLFRDVLAIFKCCALLDSKIPCCIISLTKPGHMILQFNQLSVTKFLGMNTTGTSLPLLGGRCLFGLLSLTTWITSITSASSLSLNHSRRKHMKTISNGYQQQPIDDYPHLYMGLRLWWIGVDRYSDMPMDVC